VNPLNVGLVGFGMAGQVFHGPLIHSNPNLRLTHIVERSGSKAQSAYPQAKVVREIGELLAEASVELVVVATPNVSHYEIASQALQAGQHVVVDKPFTITAEDADTLIALSRKEGLVLSVFQNRRWDGDFLTVKEILSKGLLGRLVEYESRFDRYRPVVNAKRWREQAGAGSGVLYDLGAHLIDQAVVLFGGPRGLYADVRREREGAAAVDNFEVQLEYENLKVKLCARSLVCEPSPRFVLYGTSGSYVKYGLDPQEEALKRGGTPAQPNWGAEAEEAWGTWTRCEETPRRNRYPTLAGCYQAYYDNVFGAIRGREELAVKPEQAREVIRLIELAMQSSREQRTISLS
jgi:scyllo-inositol 2-dehydrogenase (NADP+)